MAITIGTNVSSLLTQYYLNNVTDGLSKTFEQLSSGKKINNASDDASDLVISKGIEKTISASTSAKENIQNGSNFLSVTEDGLNSIYENYLRINDLLVQIADSSSTLDARKAVIDEMIERLSEINRLANSIEFMGKKPLSSDTEGIIFQIGDSDDETSTIDISSALCDCTTSAMGTDLPYFMLEDAKIKAIPDPAQDYHDVDYIVPNADKTGWVDKNGNEVPASEVASYAIEAFDPNGNNCRKYLSYIQEVMGNISNNRGLIGAYENRFESALDSLNTKINSLEETKSNYIDTDIAKTSTELISKQIMQQVNTSILTMANSLQQNALSLLVS